jgi:hypothetical protein
MKPIAKALLMLLLVVGGKPPALGQIDPVTEVEASRRKIKPIVAEYRETVKVANPVKEMPNTITWGGKDSTQTMTCGVSPGSSFVTRVPQDTKMPLADGGVETTIRNEGITYSVIESGSRGLFLKHVLETSNPIAQGFMVNGLDIREYVKLKQVDQPSQQHLRLSDRSGDHVLTVCQRKGQTLISSVTERGSKFWVTTEVKDWFVVGGDSFPKKVITEIKNLDGRFEKSFTYDFVRLVEMQDPPFVAKWKEGATVKDGDSGIVYMMQNGKLVPDPVFAKKTAEETTQRRLLFLACFLTAGGGIGYWLSHRSRPKAAQA